MGFSERKAEQQKNLLSNDRFDFAWERNIVPTVQEGFEEACAGDPNKSVLMITVYFAHGQYQAKILDRQNDEKAFLPLGTLKDCWETIERALVDNSLVWTPDRYARGGRNGS